MCFQSMHEIKCDDDYNSGFQSGFDHGLNYYFNSTKSNKGMYGKATTYSKSVFY